MPNFVPLTNTIHQNLKLAEDKTFIHVRSQQLIPVVIHEFIDVAQEFPIVFVKDGESGQFRTVALVGLKPEENLFCDENGWRAEYAPESTRGYPFALSQDKSNSERQILIIDSDCPRFNETEGQALFSEDGSASDFSNQTGQFLSELLIKNEHTRNFIKTLAERSLIAPKSLEINLSGEDSFNLQGLYVIDEQAINNLPDKDFLELKKLGYFGPIYASLLSLTRVKTLIRMANNNEK